MSVTEATFYEDIAPETCLRLMDEAMVDWLKGLKVRNQYAKVVTGWNSRAFAQTFQTHDGKPAKQAIPLPMVSLTQLLVKPDSFRWTRSPVRMTSFGPRTRANSMYVSDDIVGNEALYSGNGTLLLFTGSFLSSVPVQRETVQLVVTVGGTQYIKYDDGVGSFPAIAGIFNGGSINYHTGAVSLNFITAPDGTVMAPIPIRILYTCLKRDQEFHCPFPLPLTISYQVDIWTKTQQDMRWLRTGLLTRFGQVHPDLTYLIVEFPSYGQKMMYLEMTQDADNSDLETGEAERELRHTFTFDLHGWVFKKPYIKKNAKNVHAVIIDGSPCFKDDFMAWYNDPAHYHFNSDYSLITSIDEDPDYTPPDRVLLTLSWSDGYLTDIGP